ncbi:MAG: AbrB/MazE/SpoVT family DNA-binding domain-containing protein [Cetobacterium sp.]
MRKSRKICKIGTSLGTSIPKTMLEMMELKLADKISLEYDHKKKCIIIKREML